MKRSFFLLCAVLFVLGSLLPLAGYRLAKTVLGPSAPASSAAAPEPETPDAASLPPSDRDSETFLIADQSDGAVVSVPRRDYLIGAVAAEMPITWPDEALKAQAIAAAIGALKGPKHGGANLMVNRQQTAQHEQHGTEQKKGTFHSSPSRTGSFIWASVAGTRGEKAQISSSS